MTKPQKPDVPTPQDEKDRSFLIAMYQEHAEHARQHETLHATVATIFVSLIAGIFAYAGANQTQIPLSGFLICGISVLGLLLNIKHHERDVMHRTILGGFRAALQKGLTSGMADINSNFRKYHKESWPKISAMRLHHLWILVYVATFMIGLIMMAQTPSIQEMIARAARGFG
ncbi:MAG TPA: hypothetical protein VHL98_04245 [Microvirga sp.]|jgi:hypothetical protein|nr:hypothetical protein [Microvirga sp.]